MMAVVDQQPMSLAKSSKNLRLKFSKIYSVGKLFRISLHLKIEPACNFQIKTKSPKSNFVSNPRRSLKRKLIGIFKKFQRRPHKNRLFERRKDYRRVWLLLLLALVLAMVGFFFFFFLSPFSFFWKCIWNYTAPSSSPPRILYQFSKVIFNGICGML